jgi:AcrR family transcriptional regulator
VRHIISHATTIEELAAEIGNHRHGRVPAELRRRHIVALAAELFVERSYHEASMDELAARAGVSKPVIYALVGDKLEVFRACVAVCTEELGARVRAAVQREEHPEERLRAGARAFFAFVAEAGPAWDRLVTGEGGPVSCELDEARRHHTDVVADLLAEMGQSAGGCDGGRTEAVAHALNGAFESLAGWWRRHPDCRAEELVELATRLFTPGLLDLAGRSVTGWPTRSDEERRLMPHDLVP